MLIFFWFQTLPTQPGTVYVPVPKPTTAFAKPTKPTTPYGSVTKPLTDYELNTAIPAGITLADSAVTLGSLTVYLTGYTTDPPPDFDNKTSVTYNPVPKPTTAYS